MFRRISLTVLIIMALTVTAFPLLAQDATQDATEEPATDAASVLPVLVPHTFEGMGIESVVPDGWTELGNGIFARQNHNNDVALIAQQSAALNADDLLNALLPQLALTEAPESTGTYSGAVLEWTLYQVNVDTFAFQIKVDLALASADGMTYLVLVQSLPDDYDALHTGLFLPALDALAPLAPENVDEEDVPYEVEDVTFPNEEAEGDVTLAGTLTLPPTAGPHPAVILVSGSGPQDRDESLGAGIAIKPFRLLADALTRAGIAVLRYDDRGVGGSTGSFASATIPDFASDAEAAIRYLLTRDDIDPDQIGLIGHSEGGLVAAMLGARSDDLDFIVALAGPGVNGRDVLLVQNQRLLEAEGATQAEIDTQLAFVNQLAEVAGDPEAIEALAYELALEQIDAMTEEERARIGDPEHYARSVSRSMAQQYAAGWFESFLSYDPAPDWAQTTVPVLALFGGKDVQVDAEQNAPAIEAALTEGGNEDFEVVVLPDANHLFQQAETGAFSEYERLPDEFTPDLLPTLIDWLHEHVTVAA